MPLSTSAKAAAPLALFQKETRMPQYNPNQPRVPKGRSNGGEWTRGANHAPTDFSSANVRRRLPWPELGDRIGGGGGGGGGFALGAAFEAARATKQVADALAELAAASRQNGRDHQAVLILEGLKYPTKGAGVFDRAAVQSMTHREVSKICKLFPEVQKLTDLAAFVVSSSGGRTMSASVYGTTVHHTLEQLIKSDKSLSLRSEVSVQKTIEETGSNPLKPSPDGLVTTPYAKLGSRRIDVLERQGDTVCVYDIKTGRGLSHRRADDLALTLFLAYKFNLPKVVIVTQVRPEQNPWVWDDQP